MPGIFFRHQILQIFKRKIFIINRVNQLNQLLRQITGLLSRKFFQSEHLGTAGNFPDKPQQSSAAVNSRLQPGQHPAVIKPADKKLVFFHVSQRHHSRQQRRCQPLRPDKSLFQRLTGPPVRQQKKHLRQFQRIPTVFFQKTLRQNIRKRNTGRNIKNSSFHKTNLRFIAFPVKLSAKSAP